MGLTLPLKWQVLQTRAQAFLAPLFPAAALAQQELTIVPKFPVTVYKSVQEITRATATLKFTPEWLDQIRHPTFMQQAILRHPELSGDCDCFAAYWCVALDKSGLADEQWFATAFWVDDKTKKIEGHAVCVYRVGDKWWYAGNWNRCAPIAIDSQTAWIWDFERVTSYKPFTGTMWKASGSKLDTMILGESCAVRR
jgi:hypothetical protein